MTGTSDCSPTTTSWGQATNAATFSFSVAQTATTPAIGVVIGWTGEPAAGETYTTTSSGATGGITVYDANNNGWGVNVTGAASAPPASYSLTLTSVTEDTTLPNGTLYDAAGTLDATLIPLSGQSENVTFHATF